MKPAKSQWSIISQLGSLILTFLLLLSFSNFIAAQESSSSNESVYDIQEFVLPGGRTGNNVNSIVEGPFGYIWFGSHGGLHRYDGHRIITYNNEASNPNPVLPIPYIETLFWASDTTLWIGTYGSEGNGVFSFDPLTETFIHYPSIEEDETSISNKDVYTIAEDGQGFIWMGTENGLNKLDPKTGKVVKQYFHEPHNPNSLPSDVIAGLYVDRQGTLWVGSGVAFFRPELGGLSKYEPDQDYFINYLEIEMNEEGVWASSIKGMFEDSKGNFWIGLTEALYRMDREQRTFERMPNADGAPYGPGTDERLDPSVFSIIEDSNQNLWFGTIGGELTSPHLLRHNLATGETEEFPVGISAWHLCESRDGSIWIASAGMDGQVLRVNPKKKLRNTLSVDGIAFVRAYYRSQSYQNANKSGINPNSFEFADLIYDDLRKSFWLLSRYADDSVTHNPILYQYSNETKEIKAEFLPLFDGSRTRDKWELTSGLDIDSDGILWGGTSDASSGVFSYNPDTEQITLYSHDPENDNSLSSNDVTNTFVDSRDQVWVGTYGKGLNRINSMSGEIKRYNLYEDAYKNQGNNIPIAITEDKDGNIWIAGNIYAEDTNPTMVKLNPINDSITNYLLPEQYNFERISSLAVSTTTNLVALTFENGGNGIYDLKDNTFTYLSTTTSNFPIQTGANVVADRNGKFWLNAQYLNIIAHFEDARSYKIVETSHKSSSRFSRTGFLGDNGKLYFLGVQGIEEIDPNEIEAEAASIQSSIQITDLNIAGERVAVSENGVLRSPMITVDQVTIPYTADNFSLSFSDFDFKSERKDYSYRLLPIQEHWVNSQSPQANFYKLPEGDYQFEVKNQQGATDTLTIAVLPPWWRTWWAYALYVIAAIILGSIIHKSQKERTIRKERERTKDRELAQAKEIEKAYHQLEETHANLKATQAQLIQSEKMASLGELTAGIAHEIQNPLNFVNNFSEVSGELLVEMEEELTSTSFGSAQDGTLSQQQLDDVKEIIGDLKQNLAKIHHHGGRADSIVKGMLQHSRDNGGEKILTDINELADEYLRLAYHGMRAKDNTFNAAMETNFDESIGKIKVIPQDIGRVLLNLITNAFQACAERSRSAVSSTPLSHQNKYQPKITLTTQQFNNSTIQLSISDNGPGIPDSIKDKIFQPFFTTKPTGEGTGLGLSLSYDIVKAHGGELKVESEVGNGTTFMITLPVTTL